MWKFILAALLAMGGAQATTIPAPSCSRADVQAAIDSAVDGDLVTVPAGICTWTSPVYIHGKTVSLHGRDAQLTKIQHSGGEHTLLSIDPGSKTGRVDISGFTFRGGSSNYWGGMAIEWDGPDGWGNLRIHHNSFNNKLWALRGAAYVNGLIDHNVFRGESYGIMLHGRGDLDWSRPLQLGTSDFFFIEDNFFNWPNWYGNTGAPTLDMENGGRVVFRHNRINYGMVETHDFPRNGLPSANAWEIYNNSFKREIGDQWKGLDISAGTGVIWGNSFTGDYAVPIGGINYKSFDPRNSKLCNGYDPKDQNVPGEEGWLCQYQIGSEGQGASATQSAVYVWGNTNNSMPTGMSVTAGEKHVQEGRDFHNYTPKPDYTPFSYPHPLQEIN